MSNWRHWIIEEKEEEKRWPKVEQRLMVHSIMIEARVIPVRYRNGYSSGGIHPADTGYNQIADAISFWLKGFES